MQLAQGGPSIHQGKLKLSWVGGEVATAQGQSLCNGRPMARQFRVDCSKQPCRESVRTSTLAFMTHWLSARGSRGARQQQQHRSSSITATP